MQKLSNRLGTNFMLLLPTRSLCGPNLYVQIYHIGKDSVQFILYNIQYVMQYVVDEVPLT